MRTQKKKEILYTQLISMQGQGNPTVRETHESAESHIPWFLKANLLVWTRASLCWSTGSQQLLLEGISCISRSVTHVDYNGWSLLCGGAHITLAPWSSGSTLDLGCIIYGYVWRNVRTWQCLVRNCSIGCWLFWSCQWWLPSSSMTRPQYWIGCYSQLLVLFPWWKGNSDVDIPNADLMLILTSPMQTWRWYWHLQCRPDADIDIPNAGLSTY